MTHVYCIANQKGGVGKTTTAVNLAASVSQLGYKVLFIDLDPQGNGTMGCGVDKNNCLVTVYDLLLGQKSFDEVKVPAINNLFDVLPANRHLAGAEIELVELPHRDTRLKLALANDIEKYDFVFIDCPPSLSMLTLNAFTMATGVIIPMQCEYYPLEGLSDLAVTIKRMRAEKNPYLRTIGIVRVMYDARLMLQQQVSQQLQTHFGDQVYETVIPRNVRLAEAPSYGMPGVLYDKSSRGAKAYQACAQELLERSGVKQEKRKHAKK